jgi:hypothetical protein
MGGCARTDAGPTSPRGARILAAGAVLALATGLAAFPAGAITLPAPSVPNVAVPTPALPKVAVPAPSVPKVAVPTPALPKITVPAPSVPKLPVPTPALPEIPEPAPVAPRPHGLVPSLLAGPAAAVQAVTSAVTPLAQVARPVAPAMAPVRSTRGLVAPLRQWTSTSAARAGQASDQLSAAGGTTIRTLTGGGEVRIVPRSVCSTQVAAAQPASPALCTSVTAEQAAELGLTASPDPSPFTGVTGLALTGASIIGLVVIGALAVGLGGATGPFSRSRVRRRAALA